MSARAAGSLRTYLVTRLLLVIPNIFILVTLVFLLMRVAPGDPIGAALGGQLSEAELASRRAEAGYDEPLILQYLKYLGNVFTLDFGETLTDRRDVTQIFLTNGGATLTLTLSALVIALVLGLPLGLLAGRMRDSATDATLRVLGILTYAAPVFFLGLIFQLIFSGWLGWLPSGTQASPINQARVEERTNIFLLDALLDGDPESFVDGLEHLALPAITLGLLLTGVFLRMVRVNTIQTLRSDYVEAARARGVPERRVVVHHAFRNAMAPFITVLGLQIALLMGGAVLTEETFSWPGVGSELVRYLGNRDYVAVQGIVTAIALVVVLMSLLIDIVNALIDPRVRY